MKNSSNSVHGAAILRSVSCDVQSKPTFRIASTIEGHYDGRILAYGDAEPSLRRTNTYSSLLSYHFNAPAVFEYAERLSDATFDGLDTLSWNVSYPVGLG
jgi:hypothetical protein